MTVPTNDLTRLTQKICPDNFPVELLRGMGFRRPRSTFIARQAPRWKDMRWHIHASEN